MAIELDAVTKELLKHFAGEALRGIPVTGLVVQYQDAQENLNDYYSQERLKAIEAEIERRDKIFAGPRWNNDPHILQAIKEKIGAEGMADIMEQFTEVFIHKSLWQYRCNRHGDGYDKTPAGVIYKKELRYWCFGCNAGGDIIDFVEKYGNRSTKQAIEYCARWVGIDLRPVKDKPKQGGASLKVRK